ncbi:MAG: carboxymuconolactone decarboxylase family protein [Promethearchaeota archaeon]
MGKKEKQTSHLINTPRITPMDKVEYVREIFNKYHAMTSIKYGTANGIKSEWDNIVSYVFNSVFEFIKIRIGDISSILGIKEKDMDINDIDFRDLEDQIKEFISQYDYTYNKDSILNQYRKLMISRNPLGYHLGWDSLISKREREILILRIAWLCKSEYIWDHHIHSGMSEGLTEKEIKYIKNMSKEMPEIFTSVLISSVDKLFTDAIISEETWNNLTQHYDIYQLMDLLLSIGLYIQLATALNTLKIKTEDALKKFIRNKGLPSYRGKNENSRPVRKIGRSNPFRLDKPRVVPLNEVEYTKELLQFQNALNRLRYIKSENETEWDTEIDHLFHWLKNYNLTEINGLSSFLNLEEKGLDINSINLKDYKDSVKAFIKQKGTIFNLKAVMMKYRKVRLDWIIQASHTTYNSSLPPRDKEILILRIAWLCGAQYEWDHHVIGGRRAGLIDKEINRIREESEVKSLGAFEEVLIQSVDELYKDTKISDSTWSALSERYKPFQLLDLVFTVTSYNLLAMFLNSFGIQTEKCVKDLIKKEKK